MFHSRTNENKKIVLASLTKPKGTAVFATVALGYSLSRAEPYCITVPQQALMTTSNSGLRRLVWTSQSIIFCLLYTAYFIIVTIQFLFTIH